MEAEMQGGSGAGEVGSRKGVNKGGAAGIGGEAEWTEGVHKKTGRGLWGALAWSRWVGNGFALPSGPTML